MIRQAVRSDLRAIMQIERACFGSERFSTQTVLAMISREDSFTLIAEEDDEVVGAAMCTFSSESGEGKIASIAVLEEHRGRGIGKALLKACEESLRSLGLSLFTLEVDVDNEAAVNLYTSNGYLINGVIEGFYSSGRDAYSMSKTAAK